MKSDWVYVHLLAALVAHLQPGSWIKGLHVFGKTGEFFCTVAGETSTKWCRPIAFVAFGE